MRYTIERTGHSDYGTAIFDTPLITADLRPPFWYGWDRITNDIDNSSELPNSKNVKAHCSDWDFWKRSPSIQRIAENALKQVEDLESSAKWQCEIADCWGIRYQKGDSTVKHSHFPHSFSFVHHVSGCDQCSPLMLYSQPDVSISKLMDFEFEKKEIPFSPGTLVIFPGWVVHEVTEHQCDHPRYAVAGNISCKSEPSGKIINVDGYISGNNC